MFIAILTYKKPLEEVDRHLQAHRDYLAKHYAAGDFIIAQDPFNINGIADYQIVEFTPTISCNPNLSDLLK